MSRLSDEFYLVMEDTLDKLYDIERDRGTDHDIFVAEVNNYFGYDVGEAYDQWYQDNE